MDNNDALFYERRQSNRLPLRMTFKFAILDSSGELTALESAITKNISSYGLLFTRLKSIPIDTDLKILLYVPGKKAKPLEVVGKVARVEKLLSGEFDLGVRFISVSEELKEQLINFLDRMNILRLLEDVGKKDISDLHLTIDSPPMIRYSGKIQPLNDHVLDKEEIEQMVLSLLSDEQRKFFLLNKDMDFSFSLVSGLRFRVSIYRQRGSTEVVFRNITSHMESFLDLGLPCVLEDICHLKEGLIIIAGTTGSGKTTTITSMIDFVNKNIGGVILSLEKPIEYMHNNAKGIVKQREVGVDVGSFSIGLKAGLRQDPDVIVVGEVLDPDTMDTALQAAETGHLVITSMHATDTLQVFDRIVSMFTLEQRNFIYARLSHSLKAIITQRLLPNRDGVGRVVASEICIVNTPIKRIIHQGDFTQLISIMQTSAKYKMNLMQDSIGKLFEEGKISGETYEMYTKKQEIEIR